MQAIPLLVLAVAAVATGSIASIAIASGDRVAIVSEAQIGNSWVPAPSAVRAVAGYPAAASDGARDVCVNIGFLINRDGSTSNFVEMKSWHAGAINGDLDADLIHPFVQSAAAAVSLWRFVPASNHARPTYTSAAFTFDGSKSVASAQILERCSIVDLPAHVAHARAAVERRGSLARAQLERARAMRLDKRKGIARVSRSESEVGNF